MTTLSKEEMICENISRDGQGELCFAGQRLSPLAEKYGTPLYLYDEERIRERCRTYLSAVSECFGSRARVLYASKAACFRRLYEIMAEEGMGIDVVSVGEMYTAEAAGFPLERAYFHSNNKTDADIEYALLHGVGCFVVDNVEELYAIDGIARDLGKMARVLLRLTPGIDPHTYAAISTGKVDSKFGSAIETGQAEEITDIALSLSNIDLCGFHCHVGSQVFSSDVYIKAARVMLDFVARVNSTRGYMARELDIGGGFGVRYISEQPSLDIRARIREVAEFMKDYAERLGIDLPEIGFEPGRSIVADAGMTLYTVGTVKRIPGYKTYISMDGGMADNPRFALYGAPYTVLPVMGEVGEDAEPCSVVGRCCESGDIIAEGVPMRRDMKRGDIIACLTTGAYHYSMASNYNRLPKPPIVMLTKDGDYLAVRRETPEDMMRLEL